MVYYNENDPKAAAWLRELIKAGLIAEGEVDDRSIVDVQPGDLAGFAQCHFFAGIGGWSYALRLAGWADDRPVWTGSCPCQPFSQAGRGAGEADSRHLWPEFCRLIFDCRPPVVFGEQVASKAGRTWLGAVRDDLEALAYRIGAADLCAAGVGAPHIRQRLYWVADCDRSRCGTRWTSQTRDGRDSAREQSAGLCDAGRMGDTDRQSCEWRTRDVSGTETSIGRKRSSDGNYAHRFTNASQSVDWSTCYWLPCLDGKSRPVESGTFPLAHGVPARVGRLRGYGNAIVAPLAATFIGSYMDCVH